MKINKLRLNVLWFSVIFILFFIKTKLTGYFGRTYYGPISLKETIDKIPEMIFFSVFAVIIFNLIYGEVTKSEEKRIEAARKRLEERKKQEKEQKSENRKEEDDKNEKK
jgi:hypothetical protein